MSRKLFFSQILLLIFAQISFSQTIESNKKNTNEIPADVKKEAVALLRESSASVSNMRTLENRVSLSAEMANLMWFNDEKEARAMFQIVINNFRELLSDYDARLNSLETPANLSENYSTDSGEKSLISRKFYKAISVRQQIAKAIAEHDPQLAFEFFTDSAAAISNPTFRKQIESNDVYFETRLLNEIAAKNVDAALKYGRKTLAKNFNYELLALLRKIYEKDADKGASFGEDIVSKLKSDASKPDGFYSLTSVLKLGAENLDALKGKTGKQRPMFSEQALRDLADMTAQEILKREDGEGLDLIDYVETIERFSPSRGIQLRQKFNLKKKNLTTTNSSAAILPIGESSSVKTEQNSQKQLDENLQSLNGKKLSDEERKKVVEQAKKIIAATPNREQKMMALTALAIQISKMGDKELAVEIMNDVRSLINPQPKNYRDYMEIWMLSSGYAQVDTEKAFPILEDTIYRINETISAFVKVGEFMDVSGEMIDDGEIQVGSFGGEITRDLLRSLGSSDVTVKNLAVADFARTKALAEKFDRQEVRILAKMLILRAVLAKEKETSEKEDFNSLSLNY
jgi:hypothetical protein